MTVAALSPWNQARAQRVAVKTNALQWICNAPNLGVEARLNRRLALDVSVLGSPMKMWVGGNRVNSVRFEPRLRYYFNRPMARNFLSLDLGVGMYDAVISHDYIQPMRFHGVYAQAGLSYGYSLVLSRNWNMEFTAGLGVAWLRGFKYPDSTTRPDDPNYTTWRVVPSNLGVTLCYIF